MRNGRDVMGKGEKLTDEDLVGGAALRNVIGVHGDGLAYFDVVLRDVGTIVLGGRQPDG